MYTFFWKFLKPSEKDNEEIDIGNCSTEPVRKWEIRIIQAGLSWLSTNIFYIGLY